MGPIEQPHYRCYMHPKMLRPNCNDDVSAEQLVVTHHEWFGAEIYVATNRTSSRV